MKMEAIAELGIVTELKAVSELRTVAGETPTMALVDVML